MDASKFTTRSQQAINAAIEQAATSGHAQVEALHLLAALLEQSEGIVHPLLQAVGAQPSVVQAATRRELGRLPSASGSSVAAPSYSRAALQVLAQANVIAREMDSARPPSTRRPRPCSPMPVPRPRPCVAR
jgi:ATP-dependent Clp protease ATP-binding subunit ClpB